MKEKRHFLRDGLLSAGILAATFVLNLLLLNWLGTRTLVPMIFVLGVFLISWRTQGYFWGIASSLVSVLAVNYAFTYPYYAFDLMTPECLSSAIVMLIVSALTGTLTTQIKHQEKIRSEMERERMRGNLLRAVSHDLRTPLTSIYGAGSAIAENYDTLSESKKRELLEDIREDSQWLIRMVENLLSVTRIDGEKVSLTKIPAVLEELVDAVLVKFQKRCPNVPVQVLIPDSFVSIPMDVMLIQQVLTNILENSVDHAQGMTQLQLEVTVDRGIACFCIRDDGCGIPTERMEHLFTGYLSQQSQPVDGRRSNMGIGLSVCAAIIKAHGGEIWARNRQPRGAEFCFTLKTEENDYEPLSDPADRG